MSSAGIRVHIEIYADSSGAISARYGELVISALSPPSTVRDVLRAADDCFGTQLITDSIHSFRYVIMVNGAHASPDTQVSDCDELLVLPEPLIGG